MIRPTVYMFNFEPYVIVSDSLVKDRECMIWYCVHVLIPV